MWGSHSSRIYAVGHSGTILRYNGSEWDAEGSGTTEDLFGVGGAGDYIWVVGDHGTILKKTEPVPLIEGDVNLNGHVTISDTMFIAQHLVDIITLNADQLESADTTDDGNVTISDAMHIAQWLVNPDGTLGVLFKPLWESPVDDHMLPSLP